MRLRCTRPWSTHSARRGRSAWPSGGASASAGRRSAAPGRLQGLANAAYMLGDLTSGRTPTNACFACTSGRSNAHGTASALEAVGRVHRDLGEYGRGTGRPRTAVASPRTPPSLDAILVTSVRSIVEIYRLQGQFDRAIESGPAGHRDRRVDPRPRRRGGARPSRSASPLRPSGAGRRAGGLRACARARAAGRQSGSDREGLGGLRHRPVSAGPSRCGSGAIPREPGDSGIARRPAARRVDAGPHGDGARGQGTP